MARPDQAPYVTAHILAQLLDSPALEAEALTAFQSVMRADGCDLPVLLREGRQVPLQWLRAVYPALDADGAARLGYAAGEQARLTSYAPLSLPLISAPTIREALRLVTFLPLITNSVSAHCLEQHEGMAIVLTVDTGDPVLDRFPVFYGAAALVRLVQLLSPEAADLVVHIAWPQPKGFSDHPECIAGRLQFNALFHHITVPNVTLGAPCQLADPVAYRAGLESLEVRLAGLGVGDSVRDRVRRLLGSQSALLTIDEAARLLNLSVSTLKRRLAADGTAYRALREAVSQERAVLMLADPSRSLESVATALGYSDIANFSHAFKRWTGRSPGAFRRESVDSP